jgi:hypothetical protein
MRGNRYLLVFGLAALLGGSSFAAEVIYFTNGTTLAIRGHEVKDGMVHLDLGNESVLAFPEYMVDRIEVAGKDVKVDTDFNANRMVQGGPRRGAANSGPIDPDEGRKGVEQRIKAYTAKARAEAEERAKAAGGTTTAVPVANVRQVDLNMARDAHPHLAGNPAEPKGIDRVSQRKVMGGKIVLNQGKRRPDLVTAARATNTVPPKTPPPKPSEEGQLSPD